VEPLACKGEEENLDEYEKRKRNSLLLNLNLFTHGLTLKNGKRNFNLVR
jgi:hypothetical protein